MQYLFKTKSTVHVATNTIGESRKYHTNASTRNSVKVSTLSSHCIGIYEKKNDNNNDFEVPTKGYNIISSISIRKQTYQLTR